MLAYQKQLLLYCNLSRPIVYRVNVGYRDSAVVANFVSYFIRHKVKWSVAIFFFKIICQIWSLLLPSFFFNGIEDHKFSPREGACFMLLRRRQLFCTITAGLFLSPFTPLLHSQHVCLWNYVTPFPWELERSIWRRRSSCNIVPTKLTTACSSSGPVAWDYIWFSC